VTTLSAEHLRIQRSGRQVVTDVSFSLSPGEIVAIIGANGAGKTSLLEAVVGLLKLTSGRVLFEGRALGSFADYARTFSFMADRAEPPTEVRVDAIVREARARHRGPAQEIHRLLEALALSPLLSALCGALSRGEKRRLELFEALCTNRPVVVLDEPLGVFDPLALQSVLEVLRERARQGTMLLLSIHQLSDAEKIADRLLVLHEGRALAFGSMAELAALVGTGPTSLEAVFLALLRDGPGSHAAP
jgi:ABC-2 type transport system ATP-binding protein